MAGEPVAVVPHADEVAEQVGTGVGGPLGRKTLDVCRELAARAPCRRLVGRGLVDLVHPHNVMRPRSQQVLVRLRPPEELGDDQHRQRLGVVRQDVEAPHGVEPLDAPVEEAVGELGDPRLQAGDVPPGEGPLHESTKPGVLGGLAVEDRVRVQPVEGLPVGVGDARREDPPQRALAQDLAAGRVAGRDPGPQTAVVGHGCGCTKGSQVGVGVGDDGGVAQVEHRGGIERAHPSTLQPDERANWSDPHGGTDPAGRPTAYGRLATMTTTPGQRELTVGVGAGGLATSDMVLNIGPQHPATHGVLRLRIVLDGERIVSAEPIVGYMHRGAEKLFEVRDYRQIIVLANRHDWLSAFANELGVVLGVEQLLGMEVPERAVWARTLLAELNRVLNHLMFLGSYPLELGAITPIFYSFREREELQAVMEEASGGRMHYMFNRVGGLKEDLPAGWLGRVDHAINAVRARLPDLRNMLVGNEILNARTRGVGVLSPDLVHAYGVSGPIARASGVDVDLRRDAPYLAYGELFADGGPGRVVTRTEGDCLARLEVRPSWVDPLLSGKDGWDVRGQPDTYRCGREERVIHVHEGVIFRRLVTGG